MKRTPSVSTHTDTLFPSTTLFRSVHFQVLGVACFCLRERGVFEGVRDQLDFEAAVVDRVHGQADAVDADRTLPCDVPVQRRGRIERKRSEEHTSALQSLMSSQYAVI